MLSQEQELRPISTLSIKIASGNDLLGSPPSSMQNVLPTPKPTWRRPPLSGQKSKHNPSQSDPSFLMLLQERPNWSLNANECNFPWSDYY